MHFSSQSLNFFTSLYLTYERYSLQHLLHHLFLLLRETLCCTQCPRGCQVKTTKFLLFFLRFFPIKPLFSYRGRFIKVTKIQGWTLYKCYRLSYSGCCIKTTKSIISILSNTSLSFHHHAYKWLLHIFEALPVSTFQIP